MQKRVVKIELASIEQLDTELKANRGEMSSAMSKMKTLLSQIETLRESYAYLSGQYDSMKKAAMTLGDSAITERVVKALNESSQAYNEVNKVYQKLK